MARPGMSKARVAKMRKYLSHGLTQTQIARHMGVSQQVISYQCKLLRSRYFRSWQYHKEHRHG